MKFELILDDLLTIPRVLLNFLKYYMSTEGQEKLESIRKDCRDPKIKRILIIGHAYNYFASLIPFIYLNSRFFSNVEKNQDSTEKICVLYEIDEFNSYYNNLQDNQDTIFIFVASLGNSIQIRQGLKKLLDAKVDPSQIWGVSDYEESFLGVNSHHFLNLQYGSEKIMGSKSYINAILLLYLIGRSIVDKEAIESNKEEEIRQLIFEIKFYTQDWENHTQNLINFLGNDIDNLFFLSKGASLSSAYQTSLNFKAITQTFCVALSIGSFLHGPIRIVDENFRCVLIIGDNINLKETNLLINKITQERDGKIILLNNSRNLSSTGRSNKNIFVFEHTTENPYLAPIFEIIVLQYLILQIAKNRGLVS